MAIGLWGLTVMACQFVTNFVQLAFARVAAAIGESGCMPPTNSLIGDYFPEASERARAMSVYWLASPLSSLISFMVGGWLNELYGWRLTFFLMGLPGLALAVLTWMTITEPRKRVTAVAPARPTGLGFADVLRILWRQRSTRHLVVGIVLLLTMGAGMGPWYAAFLIRSHGFGTAEPGLWLGLIFGLGGVTGTLSGGWIAVRWFHRDEAGQMRFSATAIALLLPGFVAFLLVPEGAQALLAMVPLTIVFMVFLGPTFALLQRLVPDQMRATTLAVVMLLANLIGMGVGPQIVGILSDWLNPSLGEDSLRYAMLIVSSMALWSAYHFWRVGGTIESDLGAPAEARVTAAPHAR